MGRSPLEQTQPSLRSLGGWICPRCRQAAKVEPSRFGLLRCEADGFAFVPAEAFADADGDPFLGMTVADRYVVLGRLGAGSMGTVYRARQETMRRDVALKILRSDRALDAQAKARFTREARAMSLLTSPHTVTVFDFGEIPEPTRGGDFAAAGSSLYLAMELLEGESLGQRLKRVRRLRIDEAVAFARQALLSLAEAHDKGVIHRDLKPDNLFLTKAPSGEQPEICKVLDFGIAKVVTDNLQVDALETQAGTVFGTPRYMSPEQAQGRPLDARSDLYALGVLLYQMLVGRPPFVDDDAVVVMARHIKTPPIPPIDAAPELQIPRAVSDVVLRALSKDPNERPPSAREFVAELDRALVQGRGASTMPPSGAAATGEVVVVRDRAAAAKRSTPLRARWILALGGGTAMATLIAGVAIARGFRPRAEPAVLRPALSPDLERFVGSAGPASGTPPEPATPPESSAAPDPAPTGPAAVSAAAPARPAPRARPKTPYTRFE